MDILSCITLTGDIKFPQIANDGYSLDIFSPLDFSMPVNTYAKFKSCFIINIPEPLIGIMSIKAHNSNLLKITSSNIIYPKYSKDLDIEIQNIGSGLIEIRKGDPILQITFVNGIKIS